MSIPPKPSLHIRASALGPVAKLDAPLSKAAQNLVYARNGTGKSFLTRALRYLDLHGQGVEISDAARNLVAEESADGRGAFRLSQGTEILGEITLDANARRSEQMVGDRIFHVFSEDFVHGELRQNEYLVDGNIETKITLDHTNISASEAEGKLEKVLETGISLHQRLSNSLEKSKDDDLSGKASINRRLKEYQEITLKSLVSAHSEQPRVASRSFKEVLADLDTLKSLPAEPDYPSDIDPIPFSTDDLRAIHEHLEKITSPSTVSEDIKVIIAHHPDFFETGLQILEGSPAKTCPFCTSDVLHPPASDRIELYIAYFADAEGRHRKSLRDAGVRVSRWRNGITSCAAAFTKQSEKFFALKKLVPSQRDVLLPELPALLERVDHTLARYVSAIEEKSKLPASPIELPGGDMPSMFEEIREMIADVASRFTALRLAVASSDTERKGLHREACKVFEIEFVRSNWSGFERLGEHRAEVRNLKAEIVELMRSQLSDNVRDRVARTFEALVISFFGQKYSFDKAQFALMRDNKEMGRGPSRTLSDGEKTAIAFCYFIACIHKKVKSTLDYARVFLIFDDPITSMSYDFIFAIAQTLKNMSVSTDGDISINPSSKDQGYRRPNLLVFTHSSYFYNVCVTNKVIGKDAAFFLHKAGAVHTLSKFTKYIAPFEQHLREIVEVHSGGEPSHTTGNAIRSVLEAVGRFCHPDKCDNLSNYISFLAGEEGFEIKSVLINHLSHGTYYDETPSPEEIREACGEAILIVEKYARGQLEIVRGLVGGTGENAS